VEGEGTERVEYVTTFALSPEPLRSLRPERLLLLLLPGETLLLRLPGKPADRLRLREGEPRSDMLACGPGSGWRVEGHHKMARSAKWRSRFTFQSLPSLILDYHYFLLIDASTLDADFE
jgi:hypothetical protein